MGIGLSQDCKPDLMIPSHCSYKLENRTNTDVMEEKGAARPCGSLGW